MGGAKRRGTRRQDNKKKRRNKKKKRNNYRGREEHTERGEVETLSRQSVDELNLAFLEFFLGQIRPSWTFLLREKNDAMFAQP